MVSALRSGRRGPRFKSGQPDHVSAGQPGCEPRLIRTLKLLSRFCRDRQIPWRRRTGLPQCRLRPDLPPDDLHTGQVLDQSQQAGPGLDERPTGNLVIESRHLQGDRVPQVIKEVPKGLLLADKVEWSPAVRHRCSRRPRSTWFAVHPRPSHLRAHEKAPVPQIGGDRALHSLCTPRLDRWGMALRWAFLSLPLQRSHSEPLALGHSEPAGSYPVQPLCSPFSDGAISAASHKRLLRDPSCFLLDPSQSLCAEAALFERAKGHCVQQPDDALLRPRSRCRHPGAQMVGLPGGQRIRGGQCRSPGVPCR